MKRYEKKYYNFHRNEELFITFMTKLITESKDEDVPPKVIKIVNDRQVTQKYPRFIATNTYHKCEPGELLIIHVLHMGLRGFHRRVTP